MMYSPSPTTVTNRPLGEWRRTVGNISVDPISFAEMGIRAPSDVGVGASGRVWKLKERTSCERV